MKQDQTLELPVPSQAALSACRRVFDELRWEILEADDARLVAMEVPFRLNCMTRPADVEVVVRPASAQGSILTLVGSVRGVGARRQLDAQMAAIEKRILALVS